ncbi:MULTISPECIES: ParB N-terminal domain-containing protein [Microbacterium]|uniref:ParB-like N-terminal domain-containing protein n=1 Tax=Microbacterium hominis TaxID=162426 RepID=A0A2K9DF14_9MICO|nr:MULTISPECIES: ParB N-terminal domain-containing protein [Microbacterium]AUG29529.1 hypothetical protein CXR34_08770 [Microbacterium hominis]EPD84230.1 hypothetical protein HMPREF1529_02295 [Microbacterium sp. oral taxon 186 str. F0373]
MTTQPIATEGGIGRMVFAIRGTSHLTVPIGTEWSGGGQRARELADSITQVGLLRPVVVNSNGEIVDGKERARAIRMLGAVEAPAIRIDLSPTDVTQAAAIRGCCKGHGLATPSFVGASRATLDRVDKVFSVAEDATLPLPVRLIAAEGVAQIAAGESANGVLNRVTAALSSQQTTSRYPELAHLTHPDAMRMAAYLDTIDDAAELELELSVLRFTVGDASDDSRSLAMSVYAHMQNLAHAADADHAGAISAAIAGSALPPHLRERCAEVATQLERTADSIRRALTMELTQS